MTDDGDRINTYSHIYFLFIQQSGFKINTIAQH